MADTNQTINPGGTESDGANAPNPGGFVTAPGSDAPVPDAVAPHIASSFSNTPEIPKISEPEQAKPIIELAPEIAPETAPQTGGATVPINEVGAGAPAPSTPPDDTKGEDKPSLVTKTAPSTDSAAIHTVEKDIAQILDTVKLPERREAPVSEKQQTAPQPKIFDTTLGAAVTAKMETREDAAAGKPLGDAPPKVFPHIVAQQTQTPTQIPTQTAAEKTEVQKEKESSNSIVRALHTLKDDLQAVVRDRNISLVRAAALEAEKTQKREAAKPSEQASPVGKSERSKKMFGIFFIIAVLLVLGGAALFGVYTIMKDRASPSAPVSNSIIFAEKTLQSPLGTKSGIVLKLSLANERRAGGVTFGSITRIIPTLSVADESGASQERPATLEEFLQALRTNATANLIRSLSPNFFFGMHATNDKKTPVLIIPVSSYERAFAGMLAWEPTMNTDLSPLFTSLSPQVADSTGLPVARTFRDDIVQNYDVRELKDDFGAVELLYSFPTRSILVIAESPDSFVEMLSRLRANRQL